MQRSGRERGYKNPRPPLVAASGRRVVGSPTHTITSPLPATSFSDLVSKSNVFLKQLLVPKPPWLYRMIIEGVFYLANASLIESCYKICLGYKIQNMNNAEKE